MLKRVAIFAIPTALAKGVQFGTGRALYSTPFFTVCLPFTVKRPALVPIDFFWPVDSFGRDILGSTKVFCVRNKKDICKPASLSNSAVERQGKINN